MATRISVLGTVSTLSPSLALLYISSAGAPCLEHKITMTSTTLELQQKRLP